MAERILDLAEFEVWLAEFRELHRAGGPGSGRFARTPRGQLDGLSCADFAIIDYTVGPWPLAPSEVEARAKVLQSFQATSSGLFGENGPAPPAGGGIADPYCRTAYFAAALELLGTRPLHSMRAMDGMWSPPGMERFLDGLDWSEPGLASGRAAAVAGCFAITGDVGPEWFERFFARLAREADPESGWWPEGAGPRDAVSFSAAFPLIAIHGRFRAALARPEAIVRTALGLQRPDGLYEGSGPGWVDLGAAFALERGFRQSGEDRAGVLGAREKLLRATAASLSDPGFRDRFAADPHAAAGAVSLLALLAEALPGAVRSRRPLRLFTERDFFV